MCEYSFRPKTIVPETFSDYSGERIKSKTALMDDIHLEGLIMQVCSDNEIFYPNAFIAVVGKNEDGSNKYRKIQDKVFFNAFSPVCSKECDRDKCVENDTAAARYLLENIHSSCLNDIKIIEFGENRRAMRYMCEETGYDEIAYPVRLYNREVGVFIVGQVVTSEHVETLKQRIYAKCSDYEETKLELIINSIQPKDNLENLLERISKAISDIEKEFEESYKERQNLYILEKSNDLINGFKKMSSEEPEISKSLKIVYPAVVSIEAYERLGDNIIKQLEKMCDDVGAKDRIIFVPGSENLINNNYDLIKRSDGIELHLLFNESNEKNYICENISRYVPYIDADYDFLIFSKIDTYPVAMVIKRGDFLPSDAVMKERSLLKESFCELFSKFVSFAQMAGVEAKSEYYRVYLDSAMSIMRHELGQSNSGYKMLMERFKNMRNLYASTLNNSGLRKYEKQARAIFFAHLDRFIKNSEGFSHITNIRIQATKYLIDFKPDKKRLFYPYEEFLFKWHHIYYTQAEKARLQFRFPNVTYFDSSRPRMYGDPIMIEQAAYNLTNNAVKYALPGSIVSLDCRLNDRHNRYEIVVENLAFPLEREEELETIFWYGKRGSNYKKEGSGLGLFLTKQIALAHGGDVFCDMTILSEYNLSLLPLYIDIYESNNKYFCNDEALYEALTQERIEKQELIEKNINSDLIANENEFTAMYVHQRIKKKTARFKFTFWVPYDGE